MDTKHQQKHKSVTEVTCNNKPNNQRVSAGPTFGNQSLALLLSPVPKVTPNKHMHSCLTSIPPDGVLRSHAFFSFLLRTNIHPSTVCQKYKSYWDDCAFPFPGRDHRVVGGVWGGEDPAGSRHKQGRGQEKGATHPQGFRSLVLEAAGAVGCVRSQWGGAARHVESPPSFL